MKIVEQPFDYDIIFSTNNKQFLNGTYKNQRVVTYAAKKPKKKSFTEDDLFVADTFSFGTRIGAITNVASSICAMIPEFEKGTPERELLEKRVAMCCSAQSREIDKSKIGQAVKGTPAFWKRYQVIKESDTDEEKKLKEFYNRIECDKQPYFFIYNYKDLKADYNNYKKVQNEDCWYKFRMELDDLLELSSEDLSEEQKNFIKSYQRFLPVVDSKCVMNNLCHYIESIDFSIKKKVRSSEDFNYKDLMDENVLIDGEFYEKIKHETNESFKTYKKDVILYKGEKAKQNFSSMTIKTPREKLEDRIRIIQNNYEMSDVEFTNYLLKLFYEDRKNLPKNILWKVCGKQIYLNTMSKSSVAYFPVKEKDGDIEYLFEKYTLRKIDLKTLEDEE